MHFAGLFHLATDTTTGAIVVFGIPCALVLFGIWLADSRLKRRQMRRELEAERQAAAREVQDRKVFNAVNRFRGRMS